MHVQNIHSCLCFLFTQMSVPSFCTKYEYLIQEASRIYLDKGSTWENVKTYHCIPTTGSCNYPFPPLPKKFWESGNLFFWMLGIRGQKNEEAGEEI